MSFLLKNVSATQSKDAGLALVLICLILSLTVSPRYFLPIGTGLLLVVMSVPGLFKPFARFWFGFSHVTGGFVSRILLTVLFYGMVLPVGLVRRALGKDAMQLKKWKQGQSSVFLDRNHQFGRQDLEHPY